MKKPKLTDFNAPRKTSQELETEIFEQMPSSGKLQSIIDTPIGWLGSSLIVFLVSYWQGDQRLAPAFLAGCFGGLALWALIYWVFSPRSNSDAQKELKSALVKRQAYEKALADYQEYTSFIGKKFWLNLKGEPLEKEFQNLAAQVGWDSYLTPKSGDGGIDVICENKSQNRTLIVQCKGHSKPLGVAAIRDAVGVASLYHGEMVVVCPIGFTKGSHQLAKKSGIRLMGAAHLTKVAQKEEML